MVGDGYLQSFPKVQKYPRSLIIWIYLNNMKYKRNDASMCK